MRRALLLCLLSLAACSKGPQADLQYIAEARSLGAEWALVNTLAAKRHVTSAYVTSMRAALRKQAETAAAGLTQPASAYGAEMRALAAEQGDAAPAVLRAHSDKLKQIEDQLESA